jgi:hypothetical protein
VQSLPHESVLQLFAEISVAFVGFSMLASVFRSSRGDDLVRFADFRNVAETGLLATLGSLAPLILHSLGCENATTWRLASGGLAVLWTLGAFAANRRQNFLRERIKERPIRISFVHLVSAVVVLLGLTNALFPSPSLGGRHLLLLGLCLVQSAQLFLLAGFEGAEALARPHDESE